MIKGLLAIIVILAALVGGYWFYSSDSTTVKILNTNDIYGRNSFTISWIPPHLGTFTVFSLITEDEVKSGSRYHAPNTELGVVASKEGFFATTINIDDWQYSIGDVVFTPETGVYRVKVTGYLNAFCMGECVIGASTTSTQVMSAESEPFTIQ